jgi:hypothetical protein
MGSVREEFIRTTNILATHPGPIKDRLVASFRGIGFLVDLDNRKMPSELREEISELLNLLTNKPAMNLGEGAIHATVRAMTEDEAVEVAKQIMHVAHLVRTTPHDAFY